MDARLVLVLAALALGTVVLTAGATSQTSITPSQALEAASGPAVVKGMVDAVDLANNTFALTDGQRTIRVILGHALPSTIVSGSSAVVEGTLHNGPDGIELVAEEIMVGCPSQYG